MGQAAIDEVTAEDISDQITPQEFTARIIKFVRDGESVQIWFYSKLLNPLGDHSPVISPLAVVNVPAKVFDAFTAAAILKIVAPIIESNGHGAH